MRTIARTFSFEASAAEILQITNEKVQFSARLVNGCRQSALSSLDAGRAAMTASLASLWKSDHMKKIVQ